MDCLVTCQSLAYISLLVNKSSTVTLAKATMIHSEHLRNSRVGFKGFTGRFESQWLQHARCDAIYHRGATGLIEFIPW